MSNYHNWIAEHPELVNVLPPSNRKPPPQPKRAKPAPGKLPELPLPSRDGDTITLYLPLPCAALSPNGRVHWKHKANATAEIRGGVRALVQTAVDLGESWTAARIDVERYAAKRCDDDNGWAALKAYRDGIADGLAMNDRDFTCGEITQHVDGKRDGRRMIVLKITRTA